MQSVLSHEGNAPSQHKAASLADSKHDSTAVVMATNSRMDTTQATCAMHARRCSSYHRSIMSVTQQQHAPAGMCSQGCVWGA